MTMQIRDSISYLGKDYFGESLYIGDEVVFMQVGYRNFTRGVLISGGKTGGTIEYIKDGSWFRRKRNNIILK